MADKPKELYLGFGLIIGFAIVLILFFLPLYNGKNGLDYLDNLYNCISKGSAYYIPKVRKDASKFDGNMVSVALKMTDKRQAEQAASLFRSAGAEVDPGGAPGGSRDGGLRKYASGERGFREDPGQCPG